MGAALVVFALSTTAHASESSCTGGRSADPAVIWCDDFEEDVPLREKYHELNDNAGQFTAVTYEHAHGQRALRARWKPKEVNAGSFMQTFGRNPVGSRIHSARDFREIFWRFYLKLQRGFAGFPDKLTRATILAGANWQQAMIAHVWASEGERKYLSQDPASGVDQWGHLATTKWNDFDNLTWLGTRRGVTPLVAGGWYCIEAHVKLNSARKTDGVFEFWIDETLQAQRNDLRWTGGWRGYGINAVTYETYWNQGSPIQQERYFDDFAISSRRIGCLAAPGSDR